MSTDDVIKEVETRFEQVKHEVLALILSAESRPATPEPVSVEVEPQVTLEKAADHLGITDRKLRQMVADNYRNIPYYRPSERVLRFKLSELDAWSKRNADSQRLKAVS